ncbi:MAG: alkaline phosphatase [Eubacteriales bacterium]|nr:alkaline phosphatase [Eubacteriales bacterium]
MLKRITALILVLLTCATLAACADTRDPGQITPDTTPAEITTTMPANTTQAPAQPVIVAENGEMQYKVIRPETCSKELTNIASGLRTTLADATGINVKIDTDWHKRTEPVPQKAKEIVVGVCDRPEAQSIRSRLREKDFAIVYANERIYIIGGDDEATGWGVDYFVSHYVDPSNKRVAIMDDLNYLQSYSYPLGSLSVSGVSIMDYKIIIPDGDILAAAAAQNLSDYLYYYAGVRLDTAADTAERTDCEILVGATNRPESVQAAGVKLADDQYVLAQTASKIVMYGKSYMVGGAVSDFINNYAKPHTANQAIDVTALPTAYTAKTFKFETSDSAILLIGDGMGYNHVEATLASGKLQEFVARLLPNKGSAKTFSYSVKIGKAGYTDSAAAGTALATGCKTFNSYLGLNYRGKSILNVRELAHSVGARTAILTTDYITGATPAAFLAHVNDRNSTSVIQSQIDALIANKQVDYAISNKDSDDIINDIPEALWGIAQGDKGYFSMIEEADNDKRSHQNDLNGTTNRVVRYNSIIAYCIEFTLCHPSSVLIITADHETGGITKTDNGEYKYTVTTHTNADVPVYALGYGTECFNNTTVDNTDISKFIAKIYGAQTFGE